MKIIAVLGVRPQFIKASVITAAFSRTLDMVQLENGDGRAAQKIVMQLTGSQAA